MLTIVITPTALNFPTLTDDQHATLKELYNVVEVVKGKGHKIEGTPDELFIIILKLSYTYDIEII